MTAGRELSASEFFGGVRKGLKADLPAELQRFEIGRGHSRLLKIHFGRPELHFEAWHHAGAGRIEVGLHFEGPGALNNRAFEFFRSRMVEVKAGLPRAELEPWDRGWSRLYETLAAPVLDGGAQAETLLRLAAYVTTLQPMLAGFLEE